MGVGVCKGQPNLQAITTEQHTKATKKTLVHSDQCYRIIQRLVDERRFDQDSYLLKFGIYVGVNRMLLIPGRILLSPDINYSHNMNNFIENLVKNLNVLLDDCHQLIPLIPLLNSPRSRRDVLMFFDIGYTHLAFSSVRALIAYICGSTYSTNSTYFIRLLKQVAPNGKFSYATKNDLQIYLGELIREFLYLIV